MDCRAAQEQLSQLVDGDLDDVTAAAVLDHLIECDACARTERDLRRLADAAAELPPVDPPPELWHRIEARLDEEARAGRICRPPRLGRLRRAAWPAAIAVAAAALLVVALRPHLRPGGAERVRPRDGDGMLVLGASDEVAIRELERVPDNVLLADAQKEFRLAEDHYLKATERLGALIARDRAERPFSPALAAAYDRNLKTIDDAIARCRDLARGAPDDPWAQEVLYAAYQRKIHFLEDILREEVTR
jgi:DNA-binding SARP family transcriptional activator